MGAKSYWKRYGKKLIQRDGPYCGYCGIEVIDPDSREAVEIQRAGDRCRASNLSEREYRKRVQAHEALARGRGWAAADHIIPRAAGGTDDLCNLVIACNECNSKKHAQPPEAFLESGWLVERIKKLHSRGVRA